jgi:hypothetical protein
MRIVATKWVLLAHMLLLSAGALCQDSEIQVKAAFLYRFCGYTAWPPRQFSSDSAPIVVGVVGQQSVVDEINRILTGKSIGGRIFVIHKIDEKSELHDVHMLYFNQSSSLDLEDLAKDLRQAPVLIVTEKRALPSFSIINFVMQDNYVRFEISRTRAEEVGIELSSQLLSVATVVK